MALRALLVSSLLVATAAAALADTYPRQSGLDARHYAFDLTLTDDSDVVEGRAVLPRVEGGWRYAGSALEIELRQTQEGEPGARDLSRPRARGGLAPARRDSADDGARGESHDPHRRRTSDRRSRPGAPGADGVDVRQKVAFDANLIAFGVRDPIPKFSLPLRRGEEEPIVDLGRVLHALYDRASYDLRIDYRREAVPPLAGADAEWASGLQPGH